MHCYAWAVKIDILVVGTIGASLGAGYEMAGKVCVCECGCVGRCVFHMNIFFSVSVIVFLSIEYTIVQPTVNTINNNNNI